MGLRTAGNEDTMGFYMFLHFYNFLPNDRDFLVDFPSNSGESFSASAPGFLSADAEV